MKDIDFGKTASDYGRHRAGFPEKFFERIAEHGIGSPGQKILDLGTGTGALARGFALRGAEVFGLDPSEELMDEARRLDEEADVSVEYVVGRAEETSFPDDSFDAVVAGQCWHWFERARAAREARRVLKPGGRLTIAHFDWLPLPGNVVEATESLIEEHNPEWNMGGGAGIYPAWLSDVTLAGFEGIETFSFDVGVSYSHSAWRGRIRASAGISASLEEDEVRRFDGELGELLASRFPDDPLFVPHRVWAVVCFAPG